MTTKSNPNLRPETIKTYELVWEQYMGKNLRGSSSFYYYTTDDLINRSIDPADGLLVFRNSGKTEAQGLELGLEGRWATGIEGKVSYAFQEAKNKDTGETLTNSPKHLAKLKVSLPLLKERIFLSPELQYMSKRKTLAGNETDNALIMNVTLFTRKLVPGLEISGSVYNLLDKTYGDPVGAEFRQDVINQDGRTFRLKLTYRF